MSISVEEKPCFLKRTSRARSGLRWRCFLILSLFQQEIENPEERRKFGLFLFEQMFDASLALSRKSQLRWRPCLLGPNIIIWFQNLFRNERRAYCGCRGIGICRQSSFGALKTLLSKKISIYKSRGFWLMASRMVSSTTRLWRYFWSSCLNIRKTLCWYLF